MMYICIVWRCCRRDVPIIPSVFSLLHVSSARNLSPGTECVHIVGSRANGTHDGAPPTQRSQGLGFGWTEQEDNPRKDTEQHRQQTHHEIPSPADGCPAIHIEKEALVKHANICRGSLGISPGMQTLVQRPQ